MGRTSVQKAPRNTSSASTSLHSFCRTESRGVIHQHRLGEDLLRRAYGLNHGFHLALEIVTLIDHEGHVYPSARLPFVVPDFVEDAEDLVGIDRSQGQVVIRVAPVIEVEAAQHLCPQQPGNYLLDVLRLVMMPGIDQHECLRARCLGQQQRHSPVSDIGVVEEGLEGFVLNQQSLGWAKRSMHRLQGLLKPVDAVTNALCSGVA